MSKAIWRDMTEIERQACAAIGPGFIRYPVASPPKRFGKTMAALAAVDQKITDKQAEVLWRQVWRFRRQLPIDVVSHAGKVLAASPETKP